VIVPMVSLLVRIVNAGMVPTRIPIQRFP